MKPVCAKIVLFFQFISHCNSSSVIIVPFYGVHFHGPFNTWSHPVSLVFKFQTYLACRRFGKLMITCNIFFAHYIQNKSKRKTVGNVYCFLHLSFDFCVNDRNAATNGETRTRKSKSVKVYHIIVYNEKLSFSCFFWIWLKRR